MLTADPRQIYRQFRRCGVEPSVVPHSMLRVFAEPFSCRNPKCVCQGTGKHVYVYGADVSKGLPHGDQSVGYMHDLTAGITVAEIAGKPEWEQFAEESAKLCRWYGRASGNDIDALAAPENADQGMNVAKALMQMGVPVFIHRSDDKIKGNEIAPKLGVTITWKNKARIIDDFVTPYVGRAEPGKMPRVLVPFPEFWYEMETFVSMANYKGEINPDRPKMGAVRGKKDDRIMAWACMSYVAHMSYGKIVGMVRPQQKLKATHHFALKSA